MNRGRALQLLFAATIGSLVVVMFVTYKGLDRFHKEHQEIRSQHLSLRLLQAVLSSVKECERAILDLERTRDADDLRSLRSAQNELRLNINALSALLVYDGPVHRFDSLRTTVDSAFARIADIAPAALERPKRRNDEERDSMLLAKLDQAWAMLRSTRGIHGRLVREEESSLMQSKEREERSGVEAPVLLFAFATLALMAVTLLFWRALRSMRNASKAEMALKAKVEQLDKEVKSREFAQHSLKQVLDSSVSGIMAFHAVRDHSGRIIDLEWILANRQVEVLLDRPLDTLIGQRLLDILPGTGPSGLFDKFVEVITSGTPMRLDNVHNINGLGLHLDVNGVKLEDGLVVTYTDVSDRERQRAILRESERLALTGKIARTIAHEVRNPLTNVLLALDQIKEETGGSEAVEPYTDIVQRNVDRIAQLITEMLDSSKPREADRKPCGIDTVLDDAIMLVRDRIELQHMELAMEVAADLPTIQVDRPEMQLALSNIIVNAVEAMEAETGRLVIRAFDERGQVCIEVVDNGKGMTEEELARLFDPFYTGRPGGMGLGLTAARSILNSHGVHVDVASRVGEGTRFTLVFPAFASN